MTVSRHHKCRAAQWGTWRTKIIPNLIDPWLTLQCQTKLLHNAPAPPQAHNCTCQGKSAQVLYVKTIQFVSTSCLLNADSCSDPKDSHWRDTGIKMRMPPGCYPAFAERILPMCSCGTHISSWRSCSWFCVSLVCLHLTESYRNCPGSRRLSGCTRIQIRH